MEIELWVSKLARLVSDGEQEPDDLVGWKLAYSRRLRFYRAESRALASSEEEFDLTLWW